MTRQVEKECTTFILRHHLKIDVGICKALPLDELFALFALFALFSLFFFHFSTPRQARLDLDSGFPHRVLPPCSAIIFLTCRFIKNQS